jgi:hypothetical protein
MSTLLEASLGLLVAIVAAVLVAWTIALAAGDAEELADELARLIPGRRRTGRAA